MTTRTTAPMNARDWDPQPHERTYYRHAMTGDLGWLVRRNGADFVHYDRPAHTVEVKFLPDNWIAELEHRPMTLQQIAQVAFEADKKLCHLLGLHDLARREWLSLRDHDRIAWCAQGPRTGAARKALFAAVVACLQEQNAAG